MIFDYNFIKVYIYRTGTIFSSKYGQYVENFLSVQNYTIFYLC
jgi:hypothetical protein